MRSLLILLAVFVASWDVIWRLAGVKPLSPRTLRKILAKTGIAPRLIDVRTSREYTWMHIREAENYPNVLLHPEELPLPESGRPVVIICLSGHRSPLAAYRLKQHGFQDVSYLAWGMIAWLLSGGPTVRGGSAK